MPPPVVAVHVDGAQRVDATPALAYQLLLLSLRSAKRVTVCVRPRDCRKARLTQECRTLDKNRPGVADIWFERFQGDS